jgi:hypothetical protein
MSAILRPKDVFGPGKPLPIGQTNFDQNYVLRDEADPYVPGTTIPRLRPTQLGPRAIGYFDDEVFALVENLRRLRDDPAAARPPRVASTPFKARRKRSAKRKAA